MWTPADFYIATKDGTPRVRSGYTYRALGLHSDHPKDWSLTHLFSGHRVCKISGSVKEAFLIATDIAECSEWDFIDMRSWKNRDPDLREKVLAILDMSKGRAFRSNSRNASIETAKAVAALAKNYVR